MALLPGTEDFKPLATLPGVTEPVERPPKNLVLETQMRMLERNCRNMHPTIDYKDASQFQKEQTKPTMR